MSIEENPYEGLPLINERRYVASSESTSKRAAASTRTRLSEDERAKAIKRGQQELARLKKKQHERDRRPFKIDDPKSKPYVGDLRYKEEYVREIERIIPIWRAKKWTDPSPYINSQAIHDIFSGYNSMRKADLVRVCEQLCIEYEQNSKTTP